MMKKGGRWIWDARQQRIVPADEYRRPEPARSHLPAPMIMADTIEPTQSMADGKFYTSKAAIRATYKPSGNPDGKRYVELGDDPAVTKPYVKPKPDRKAIRASVERAFSRTGFGA